MALGSTLSEADLGAASRFSWSSTAVANWNEASNGNATKDSE
jgi:hypothetical protein